MQLENSENIAFTKGVIRHYARTYLSVKSFTLPTFSQKVASILSQLTGTPKEPSRFELDGVFKRLTYAAKHASYEGVLVKDWKLTPYVLWMGEDQLGSDLSFLNDYLLWLKGYGTARDWRRLIHVYLRDYEQLSTHHESLERQNFAIIEAINSTELKGRLIKWHSRELQYSLFAKNPKLDVIVNEFIDCKNEWRLFSERTGLEGELAQVGFAVAVGDQLLKRLMDSPSSELIQAVKSYHVYDDKLRFPQRKAQLIEALISPWLNGKQLGEPVQKAVRDWLLKHFSDLRLPVHDRAHWHAVRPEYKKIMLRWLIGETLNQFFEIIDQVAKDSHWSYRKAFWNAYYKKDAFDEAWVVLGVDAKYYARRVFGEKISAATLSGSARQDHSVLIVRIGDLVLADWSHDGKCRAWKVDDRFCPERYKLQYSGDLLRAPSMQIVDSHVHDGISHHSSDNYLWQNRLSQFIYEHTGVRVYQRDFRI